MRLFHITKRADWAAAKATGEYRPPSLAAEGFIHLSTDRQWQGAANRFYRGQTDLILLWIRHTFRSELRWEQADGETFPHLYAPLSCDLVIETSALVENEHGFEIPANVAAWREFFYGPPRIVPTSAEFARLALAAHFGAGDVAIVAVTDHGAPVFYVCFGALPGFEGKISYVDGRATMPPLPRGLDSTGWLHMHAFPRNADGSIDAVKLVARVQTLVDLD